MSCRLWPQSANTPTGGRERIIAMVTSTQAHKANTGQAESNSHGKARMAGLIPMCSNFRLISGCNFNRLRKWLTVVNKAINIASTRAIAGQGPPIKTLPPRSTPHKKKPYPGYAAMPPVRLMSAVGQPCCRVSGAEPTGSSKPGVPRTTLRPRWFAAR